LNDKLLYISLYGLMLRFFKGEKVNFLMDHMFNFN